MLPTLSRLSVSSRPEGRLRRWCSSRYLRISPLHREFHPPLRYSSRTVSNALPGVSPGISHRTYPTACTRFTPSDSEQRLRPPSYRGCWHGVSRRFLWRYRQRRVCSSPPVSFPLTAVYTPKGFLPHAVSLGQPFGHCPKFPTAASRRSLGRVSVPMWGVVLSDPLAVVALVGRYPTNQLIAREPLPARQHCKEAVFPGASMRRLRPCGISPGFPGLSPAQGQVAHVLLTRPPLDWSRSSASLDLHVLGTPPAFVLSQDQTLHRR